MNAILFIGLTRVVRRRLLELVRDVCCGRWCKRQVQWRVLEETAADSGSPNPTRRTELPASSSLADSESLSEDVQVLRFQSSSNSYGAAGD